MKKDTYQTIKSPSEGEFKDRGSKFIAYAFSVFTEEECSMYLDQIRKEHIKARHHCYAWRLGLDKNKFRANDDGEPSGTAGRPMLGQIDSFNLTNTIVIVVRYFGGTKLGTSGLINAYKTSTYDALSKATIIKKTVKDYLKISFDYKNMSTLMNFVKSNDIEVNKKEFADKAFLEIAIPQGNRDEMVKLLKANISGKRVEEVDIRDDVDGLDIEFLFTK